MKKRYYVLALVVLLGVIGAGAYFQYNKPARNLAEEKADLSVPATELYRQFSENEAQANQQYLDKVVLVKGTIKSFAPDNKGGLNLALASGSEMGDVTCEFAPGSAPEISTLKQGQPVTVKGQCTGYLTDVLLVKCVLSE